jgi:GT2 family glycosyltransferase
MTPANLSLQVTALVKTFERPRALDRLIRSLRRYYPALRVIVGDDSVTAFPRLDVDYVRLPVDIGVAAGRNAILELVQTPYFLSLDDDFAFTQQTCIEKLIETLERHDAALVAGDLIRCEQKLPWWIRRTREVYHGLIRREGESLQLIPGHATSVGDAYACDVAPHFFLANTEAIRNVGGWFGPLKMDEHQELLFRLKDGGLCVLHRPDVSIEHWQDRPEVYAAFRARDFLPLVASRHGLRRITDLNGNLREFPPLEHAA